MTKDNIIAITEATVAAYSNSPVWYKTSVEKYMQQYSDLQNKELTERYEQDLNAEFCRGFEKATMKSIEEINKLKSQLAEKDKEVNSYHNNYIKQLEYANKLQSELTELKEKHNMDEESDFKCECGYRTNSLEVLWRHLADCPLNKK